MVRLKAVKKQALVAVVAVLAGPGLAQGIDASLDANGDGMMSFPELLAGYPELAEDTFTTMDQNGDGLLDAVEISDGIAAGLIAPSEG